MNELKHVLVIPDGNRRYARQKDIDIPVVYKFISDNTTTELLKYFLIRKGIPELSFFAIARNNVLKRNDKDLDYIYEAQIDAYNTWLKISPFNSKIKFRFIGDLELLPKDYREAAKKLEDATKNNKHAICNLLAAYDGQWEIIKAIEKAGEKKVDVNEFYNYLQIKTPIDMIIRTGGEKRFSGAPIYQSTYAELFFLDKFYPELTIDLLDQIVGEFKQRERRFGK